MTGRDWKQIEAELDDLKPGGSHKIPQIAENPLQPKRVWGDEEAVLEHIADALRMERSDTPG